MKQLTAIIGIALLGSTLAGCGNGQPNAASTGPIAAAIDRGLDQAETKLTTQNITLDDDDHRLPEAAITPQGDLLIAGKAVALSPAQRQQVLAYRQQIIAVGQAGIAVGRQGASIGLHVAGTAIAAALAGESSANIEQKVQSQTQGIKQAAAKLCDRLPALRESQQELATAVPAFKPYATMTHKDIEDCRVDALNDDDTSRVGFRRSIRDRIRSDIRSTAQHATQSVGLASSGTSSGIPATDGSTARR